VAWSWRRRQQQLKGKTKNQRTIRPVSETATLWLECDSTTTQRDLRSERRFQSLKTGWRNCGWSETRQQHRKHNTKRTMLQMTSKPVEFSPKNSTKMRSDSRRIGENCGWSVTTTTTQKARNRNAKKNRDEKCEDRLEMFVGTKNTRTVLKCLFTMGTYVS